MHRWIHLVAISGLAATALTLTAPGQAATGPTARASLTTVPTAFAMRGSAYGTAAAGGQAPAGSRTTSFMAIGCQNKAGLLRTNHTARLTNPSLGTLSGLDTRISTSSRRGVVAQASRHSIARLTLVDSPQGSLTIDAISSLSRAYHDGSGFHSTTRTRVGTITLTPPTGDPQTFPAPTPGQPVDVPGLARISLGASGSSHGAHGATASARALVVHVVPTDSTVRIASTKASIQDGVRSGLFHGSSFASRADGLGNAVTAGRNPLSLMPCQGTDGHTRTKSLARVNLGGNLVLHGLSSTQMADQDRRRSWGYEQGRVASLNLGDGALVVRGIVGRATVRRTPDGVTRTSRGTTIGSVTANGQTMAFPKSDVLEIPGVARLERDLVSRSPKGISVTALRLTLLDGSGAVVYLGRATLLIRRSGL